MQGLEFPKASGTRHLAFPLLIFRQGTLLKTQQIIDGVIACGKLDAVGCRARGEQGCNGVGPAAVLPVRAGTGSYGELKRGAVAGVESEKLGSHLRLPGAFDQA